MIEGATVRDNAFKQNYLTDLHHEIEDTRSFTWRVTNWPKLDKRVKSPEFICGGDKWNILLFPFGNSFANSSPVTISLFVEHSNPKNLPEGWHSCVQFAIAMSNPKDPGCYFMSYAQHRFISEEHDWGFSKYAKLKDMMSVQEGKTRPIIEMDATDITVYMRVLKDPTGVLWHNFINYDSKKHTGYVGVKNQGATDVLCVCLQFLFCFTALRKILYKTPCREDTVTSALQNTLHDMQTSNSAVSSVKLTKSFGWGPLDSFMAHDVVEMKDVLQDKIEEQAVGTLTDGAHTRLLVGKSKIDIQAINMEFETSYVEEFRDILVEVKGMRDLNRSLRDYVSLKILDGDLKYDTKTQGLQAARKRISFMSFPPILHIHLKRADYDAQQGGVVKYTTRHEYPPAIDLAEFLDTSVDKTQSWEYRLHGAIVYSGNSRRGHYYCFIKPGSNARWLKFDDDRVMPASDLEVFEESYGQDDNQARYTDAHVFAYVLVYVRAIMIDEVFGPVKEVDIPPQLRARLEQEQSADIQRKGTLEQASRQITVKVVDDESFRKYQGFDLASFSSSQIASFRVPRNQSFQTFKSTVAKHFKCDQTQFRLWTQVNRTNKTVRADTLIADNDLSLTVETVCTRTAPKMPELLLYLDVKDKAPMDASVPTTMIFLKYFDASKQSLLGLGRRHVPRDSRPIDLEYSIISEMKLPGDTCLQFYEEIKPGMIEPMKPNYTFALSEIGNGDIVCVQTVLSAAEINRLENNDLASNPVQFYARLRRSSVAVSQPTANLTNPV